MKTKKLYIAPEFIEELIDTQISLALDSLQSNPYYEEDFEEEESSFVRRKRW
jgi:hypothetical protein